MKNNAVYSRTIEVCLSRDRSAFSWFTYFTDGGGLTHASIAFDEDDDYYYSFNMKGFRREYKTSLKKRPRKMKRYLIAVTEEQYRELKRIITEMESRKGDFSYARMGAVLCLLKIPSPTIGGQDRMFCSQFVAKVLDESGCVHMTRSYAKITPNGLEKQMSRSAHVSGIIYESDLEPIQNVAAELGYEKIDQAKNVLIEFSVKNYRNVMRQYRKIPTFVFKVGITSSDQVRRVVRTIVFVTKKSRYYIGETERIIKKILS